MPADSRSRPLCLESLDDRLVPAVVDLTARGAVADVGGGIVRQLSDPGFRWWNDESRSFVRLKKDGAEQGYNTNARPLHLDELRARHVTHAITIGQVPRRTVDGAQYREFLLNIDQNDRRSKLSVDEVKVFVGDRGNLTGYDGGQLPGARQVFDLDAGGDVSVLLDAKLNRRHGADDMVLLVPEAAFAGGTADTHVYLYSKLGGQRGAAANGGFEEWALKGDGGGAPGPAATPSLSGSVLFDPDGDMSTPDTVGVAGVAVYLSGTDDLGNPVDLVTFTDDEGRYSFPDLRPGVYSLREEQPEQYGSLGATAGALGGDVSADFNAIANIRLDFATGVVGTGYNFVETLEV